jgi:hypothetical protein
MLADLLGVADGTASTWHKETAATAPATSPPACGNNTSRPGRPDRLRTLVANGDSQVCR